MGTNVNMSGVVLAVLLSCHNRKRQTVKCLERLFSQNLPSRTGLRVYLVDDGSTDGTRQAIQNEFPAVHIIQGSGNLFWCRGMRLAWQTGAVENPEFYLWLNDDTTLENGAVQVLYDTWYDEALVGRPDTIVVGSCCDPDTGGHTYGGRLRLGGHPLILKPVPPGRQPQTCDTFEGNVVLVPRAVFEKVGMIGEFQHAMGDTDYGYRAAKAGCQLLVAPGFLASCKRNPPQTSYWYQGPSRSQRWRLLNSRKGMPPRDWLFFARRHGGSLWFLYWLRPYLRVLLDA